MRTITNLTLAVLVLGSLLAVPTTTGNAKPVDIVDVECDGDTRMGGTNIYGRVEYAITYNRSAQRVCAVAESTGERKEFFGYSVWVDGHRISSSDTIELEPGDVFRDNQTIPEGIDATKIKHTIEVHVYNDSFYFNFTQRVNTMNESGVPTPHVERLRVKRNGTKSGQPRLIVEVENKGVRTYVPEAEVRTFKSDSRRLQDYVNASPGGRYSVRLSEANDAVIVGTVRLYGGKFNPGTKFDRVSFVSYPNGTYKTWEPAFGEIPTDRQIEQREVYYENESAREKYAGPDVDPISERTSKLGAIFVVAALLAAVWYRRRNRR